MAFHIELVTPEATILSGSAVFVLARALNGDLGILEGHAPMVAGLGTGKLEVHMDDGEVRRFLIDGGFLEATPDKVVVLADTTEDAESIDLQRALQERDRLAEEISRAEAHGEEVGTKLRQLRLAEARVALAQESQAR